MKYRLKVQFFSPDHIPTAIGEFTVEEETITRAILKEIDDLENRGYNRNYFIITFIGEENEI